MGIDKKNTYVMYRSWSPMFLQMDDAELGRLMKDVCRYQDGEDIKPSSPIFALLKQAFEENSRKYEESCNNKRRNAMKGVLKRSTPDAREIYILEMDTEDARALLDMTSDMPEIQKEIANRLRQDSAKGSTCYQMPTSVSKCQHYDNDNEYENETVNENEYGNGNGEKHPHGNQQNIYLTDTEYFSLVREYGTLTVKEAIDNVGYAKKINRFTDIKTDYQRINGFLAKEKASCRM